MKQRFILFLSMTLLWTACDVINPDEPIPAYLDIQPFSFTAGFGRGTDSHQITDAWVYINDTYHGTFTLPTTIPIISEGETKITIFPGIKDNGNSSTPDIYTLYQIYETTLDFQPNETFTIRPSTTYDDNVILPIVEDFETGGNALNADLDENPATIVRTTSTEVFEGQRSGWIQLTRQDSFIVAGTAPRTDFPRQNATAYMELNYKSDVAMAISLIGLDQASQINFQSEFTRIINAKSSWNKIYLNFTQAFRDMEVQGDVDAYQVMVRTGIPFENGELSREEADIFLDNMKIVHF